VFGIIAQYASDSQMTDPSPDPVTVRRMIREASGEMCLNAMFAESGAQMACRPPPGGNGSRVGTPVPMSIT
jgi:hypothetical protein